MGEKWIIEDENGARYGKPVYVSMQEANDDLPNVSKRLEESGVKKPQLHVKQILES